MMNVPPAVRTPVGLSAVALALGAVLAIAGFTALGTVFAYPQILAEPVDAILERFREHRGAVRSWFGVLVVGAALLAPAGLWLGRATGGRLGRALVAVGVAAAAVQVAGLQRWVTLVPRLSADALEPGGHDEAVARFAFWHHLLGTIVGETSGYALTATFTVLLVVALRRWGLPRWLQLVGVLAAVLVATGVVVPLVPAASLTNFLGYVLWCAWVLIVSALLLRAVHRANGNLPRTPALRETADSRPSKGDEVGRESAVSSRETRKPEAGGSKGLRSDH